MRVENLVTESPYVRRARRARPTRRLFCFPFAGAGASTYRHFPEALPAHIEVVAIQLPGREDRLREAPFTRTELLVRALAQVLRPYLDLPAAFFGHSGGALLAFETARALAARTTVRPVPAREVFAAVRGGDHAPAPSPSTGHSASVRLIVSGHQAPQAPSRNRALSPLPDDEFLAEIVALNGTAPDVVDNEQLRRVVLPPLRADVAMWESYRFQPGPPLAAPITVFGGDSDPLVPESDLAGWRDHTTGAFRIRHFRGGHFFLHESVSAVLTAIEEELR